MSYTKTLLIEGALATADSINDELTKIETGINGNLLSADVYLDTSGGNDTTATGTSALPFLTLQAAIDSVSTVDHISIYLLSDLVISDKIDIPVGGNFELCGAKVDATDSVVTFAAEAGNDSGNAPRLDYFFYKQFSFFAINCSFQFREFGGSIANPYFLSGRSFTTATFLNCTLEALSGCNQSVIGPAGGFGLAASGSTLTNMSGHWVSGVTASTDPLAVKNCAFSTISAL